MPTPTRAIVRPPGRTYPQALTRLSPAPPVDPAAARVQHAGYVAALRQLGLEVSCIHFVPFHEFEKRDGGVTCVSILY